jgi:tetratricopeptide (TPR) repeat protein
VFVRLFVLLVLTLVLANCATSKPGTAAAQAKPAVADAPSRPFPADTLYALLVAEFAGARDQPELALKNYTEQAQKTRDIGVAERATQIAQITGADQQALENAELWSSLDPQSAEPDAVIADAMLKQGKLMESFDASLNLLDKGYSPQFQSIAARTARSDAALQKALLERFDQTLAKYPKNSPLLLGKSLLLHLLGNDDEAMRWCDKAIAADPANSGAYLLMASFLETKGERKQAADILYQRLQHEPYDPRVHLQYARLLAAYDLPAAEKEFKRLVDRNPFDGDLLLALAITCKEAGDKVNARAFLEQLLFIQKHQSTAYFFLGQISEADGDTARAMEQYRRVSDGDDYFYAMAAFCQLAIRNNDFSQCQQHFDEERVRLPSVAARLYLMEAAFLEDQKHLDQSLAMLNHALTLYPRDLDLLYSRSMVQDQQGHLADSEADLHRILSIDQNNANALNALGYVLATKTDRLTEAYGYISRALALEPDNAAIIDSMGWVLYRLHRNDEALTCLNKAMSLYPNHEIAAHLGEVFWVTGKQEQARATWKKGLEDKPDSEAIQEAMQRLKAN